MIRMKAAVALGAFSLDVDFESDARVLALFGRSGSGKSVTIALVAGLMAPDRGTIAIDGRVLVDTEKGIFVPKHRRRIGLVYQDARLFPHLTVRQNLMFGRWFAGRSRGEADDAPKRMVDFDAVVTTLGIAHLLGRRPGRLSGGERQRISIARALLKNAPILILDEATSALDSESEKLVQQALTNLIRDRTTFVIAHRLSTIRNADLILVIDQGRIVESGTHDSLIAQDGFYRKFFRLQNEELFSSPPNAMAAEK